MRPKAVEELQALGEFWLFLRATRSCGSVWNGGDVAGLCVDRTSPVLC